MEVGADVYINTVCTFGVAFASYCWSRVVDFLDGRRSTWPVQGLARGTRWQTTTTWKLRASPLVCTPVFFRLVLLRCTASLLEQDSRRRYRGVGRLRAALSKPSRRDLATPGEVVHKVGERDGCRFQRGLGRIMYVVGALELERPFLGPLYRFMSLHPRTSVRRIPTHVSFFLCYLAEHIAASRHHNCAMELHPACERADQQHWHRSRRPVPRERSRWEH